MARTRKRRGMVCKACIQKKTREALAVVGQTPKAGMAATRLRVARLLNASPVVLANLRDSKAHPLIHQITSEPEIKMADSNASHILLNVKNRNSQHLTYPVSDRPKTKLFNSFLDGCVSAFDLRGSAVRRCRLHGFERDAVALHRDKINVAVDIQNAKRKAVANG